ncbi:MAG: endonuclease/exonuclease/phosphatase family protein [Desulfobacterales bacterium]|jgi:endonuclease/exonuclease/phosphatase family metal-dependent hydrolase|nr:endonuclease/exonuclease/phosphatase family protein [Deltaproteobacteria bacterium]
MGHAYDFNRFLTQHPRPEGDRRRLRPERVAQNLLDLRATLEDPDSPNYVPSKSDTQLLLATWNIQHFGSSKRYDESLWYIAEILSRFDLIAVQEVKQSLRDLELVTDLLGPWWKYIVSDVTAGDPGNEERLAYLFDNRRVRFSGLAGEIVLPPIEDAQGNLYPARQLVRTPYMAGFMAGWFSFILSTVHLIWGEEERDYTPRVEEVEQLTDFLVNRQSEHGAWSRNMILLGDFNMFDPDGIAARALKNSGFSIPHGREDLRATNVGEEARFYDQIAFLLEDAERLNPTSLGVVDFFDAVYSDDKFEDYEDELRTASGTAPANPWRYYRNYWRRREMSDHLLLWVQLPIDFSNIHLSSFVNP